MTTTIDYTIVICTYNPDERILTACLKAVAELDRTDITTEVILVDNNSSIPVKDLDVVKKYEQLIPAFKLLHVPTQGVMFARIAAINAVRGNQVVYVDYDNEPASNYLIELKKLNSEFPNVAAWGPGNVEVKFIDGIDKELEEYGRIAFQQRNENSIQFGDSHEWQPYYPFGTGLCTKTSLLREYVEMEKAGQLTLQGRKGELLTSGEDTQMILVCISKGYAAGVAPSLRLNHLINGQKANLSYLKRLAYGTSVCYETCLVQVFPERKTILENKLLNPIRFSKRVLRNYLKQKDKNDPMPTLQLAQYIGANSGIYKALGKSIPWVVRNISKRLKLY